MTTLVKTVPASELPSGWQAELGVSGGEMVRVEMQELIKAEASETPAKSLARLHAIKPAPARIDTTAVIRAERDQTDGRSR